ncbi:very short patch repair endonuclease [Sphingopyxis jiangsuensis]|uniref:very short patch repair endonuclease n=1 Tax=Sphingopyxis jiangsuensis TaxID=2871171 RepID=UPI0022AA89D3|nr:DNA mismatch endonuclease Vsr [Sphingopyxis lutea]
MPGDIVDPATRSRMMGEIRSKNTQPELAVRRALHASGFRFRLHSRDLPGKPDIVLSKWKAVILVHGCFWHGHDCPLFKLPSTKREFWNEKIGRNKERDRETIENLRSLGWRVLTVWECSLKGKERLGIQMVADLIDHWLREKPGDMEIRGMANADR